MVDGGSFQVAVPSVLESVIEGNPPVAMILEGFLRVAPFQASRQLKILSFIIIGHPQ
jgi:hypothetical protein